MSMVMLSEDDRIDLAMAAQASERRHRPRHFVVFATIVLIAGIVALVMGLTAYRRAASQARIERNNLVMMQRMDAELAAMAASGQTQPQGAPYEPVTGLQTRLEGLAIEAGLTKPTLPTERRDRAIGNAQRVRLEYRVRHATPQPLLGWVEKALQNVPGLEVWSITIKPEATDWSMSISFSRWERTGP